MAGGIVGGGPPREAVYLQVWDRYFTASLTAGKTVPEASAQADEAMLALKARGEKGFSPAGEDA